MSTIGKTSQETAQMIDKTKNTTDLEVASKSFKEQIISTIIQPSYIKDIKDTLAWRYKWRKIGNTSHMMGKILTLSGAAVAFSSGFVSTPALAFVSGCVSLSGILCIQYGDYSYSESSRETEDANKILKTLGIEGVPELTDDANFSTARKINTSDIELDDFKEKPIINTNKDSALELTHSLQS